MKSIVTTVVELAGALLVSFGIGVYNTAAGLIAAGLFCLGFGYLGGRE